MIAGMMMNQIDQILRLAEVFAEARGLSQSRVSTLVFNDGKRLRSLREGKDMGVRSAETAHQWFSDNWPDNAVWPHEIERPDLKRPFPEGEAGDPDREVA